MYRLLDLIEQFILVGYICLLMAAGYVIGIVLIMQDRPLLMWLSVVIFSPVMMLVWRMFELKWNIKQALRIFNPSRQSWAFIFGDTFMLSSALLSLTRGWSKVPSVSWFHSKEWALVAVWVGFLLSLAFIVVDSPRYKKAGVSYAHYSPTKMWHDYAVFPVVLSLILFAGVPQLRYWSTDTGVAVCAILLFVGLCVADAVRDQRGVLNPADQHFNWDPLEFRIARV